MEPRSDSDMEQQRERLLQGEKLATSEADDEATMIHKVMCQTFQSTAHLANLLPTGTVLAFQLLAPIFTDLGQCDGAGKSMTAVLVLLCGVSCFFSSFTDSYREVNGKVRYGVTTVKGLWVIDGAEAASLTQEEAAKYRLRALDFVHAFLSVLVFGAVTLFNQNVVECFYPTPSEETKKILTALPIGIGVISSMLFVTFPTQRHGLGFSLSSR